MRPQHLAIAHCGAERFEASGSQPCGHPQKPYIYRSLWSNLNLGYNLVTFAKVQVHLAISSRGAPAIIYRSKTCPRALSSSPWLASSSQSQLARAKSLHKRNLLWLIRSRFPSSRSTQANTNKIPGRAARPALPCPLGREGVA